MKKLLVLVLVVVSLLAFTTSALAVDPPGGRPTKPTGGGIGVAEEL